jgi:hypothetical protein
VCNSFCCAPERIRTSTAKPQGPEPCASTNSATGAKKVKSNNYLSSTSKLIIFPEESIVAVADKILESVGKVKLA